VTVPTELYRICVYFVFLVVGCGKGHFNPCGGVVVWWCAHLRAPSHHATDAITPPVTRTIWGKFPKATPDP
jgi:hypothetical protein